MSRLKTFLIYVLAIAALWIFSDIIIYISINGAYKNIETNIYTNSPEIIVGQSKATYVNGYIKGGIKNNTNDIINNKYLKIDLYSSSNVLLGTKYIKLEEIKQNEYREFEMWYKFTNVQKATVTIVDNIDNASSEEFLSQEASTYMIISALLMLYFI